MADKTVPDFEDRLAGMERSHSCPHYPDRVKWCEREPCDTAWAIAEIRKLRESNSDLAEKWMRLRCEYVDCDKPGPHDSHSVSGVASAAS